MLPPGHKVRPRITKRSARIMTAQAGYLVTRALERKRERERREEKKGGGEEGEVSAHRHLACIVRVSVDQRGSRAMYFVRKRRSAILECRSLRTFAVAASFYSPTRSRCTRQCSCNSSHDNIF